MRKELFVFVLGIFMISLVSAQLPEEIGNPGMTPDSNFYFLDKFFDNFQSVEAVADEKAAEILAMAQKNNSKGIEVACEQYNKSMEKMQNKYQNRYRNKEQVAERVANSTSKHLAVLAEVLDKVPEQAKGAIEGAMQNSAKGRENSLNALKQMNPEKGEAVEEQTKEKAMANNSSTQVQNRIQNQMQVAKQTQAQNQTSTNFSGNGQQIGQ